MPKDNINYRFTENGIVYDFYDVFVPAENFRQPALWVWGGGGAGELGNFATTNRSTPVTTFAGGTNWKSVSCGGYYTAAIKTDGTLWMWGFNSNASLGVNDGAPFRSIPVTTFAGGTNWKSVSCGIEHTAAIKTDGTLWNWGRGTNAQLGINGATNRSTPVTTFAGGTDWKSVSCGSQHTAAIKTDGSLWTWGYNNTAQLGNFAETRRSTPVTTFAGGTNWKSVSCGGYYTAAIKTDGTLWMWGNGSEGKLGVNDTTTRSTPVTTFAGGNNWKQVSCGSSCTAAIKTDGSLWVWGSATDGRLGTNNTDQKNTPVTTFAGGTNWKQVSAGSQSAAIKTDGSLWVWGRNNFGQLGVNDTTNRSTPVTTFAGGNNWKQVADGTRHTIAIKYSPDP